ncbi:MAG: HAMP domain-containing protein [Bacteroidia bacterium]|nr:HAMP domain-containing protein [Bacteroidia bacterium]
MNLKLRSALLFTAIMASILLICYTVIYALYAEFKQEEFFIRLEQKGLTTYKLWVDVKEMDKDLLRIIDKNTLNELYDEKVLIFNEKHQLMYNTLDDHLVTYTDEMLKQIEKETYVSWSDNDIESVGLFVNENNKKGIVLISANDKFGKRKLQNLLYILIISYLVALSITAFLSYFYVKQVFAPIDVLNLQMNRITEQRMDERVVVKNKNDELGQLATNFNKMLDRLQDAFNMQKSFIQHASHELRTPLANLIASCESAMNKELTVPEYKELIVSLNEEHKNLVSLTNALLLLSKYESMRESIQWPEIRIDEILFQTIEETQELFTDHQIYFDYHHQPETENLLSIPGHQILLKTALSNLLRNACQYSSDNAIHVQLSVMANEIQIYVRNKGALILENEKNFLFQPFFRGENSIHKKGYGLGLAIANRIIHLHKGKLMYVSEVDTRTNTFSVILYSEHKNI